MSNQNQPNDELQCVTCELCMKTKVLGLSDTCDREKNGYCALFRLQAARDKIKFNMKGK